MEIFLATEIVGYLAGRLVRRNRKAMTLQTFDNG